LSFACPILSPRISLKQQNRHFPDGGLGQGLCHVKLAGRAACSILGWGNAPIVFQTSPVSGPNHPTLGLAVWAEWLHLERGRLQLKYAEILCALSEHYFAEGDVGNLIHTGRRLIDHNPLCEEGHRALMGGYTLGHQKSLALKQYELYRDIIQAELNSPPEPKIRELYESIRNGEAYPDLGSAPCWVH
jgi:hypothetical protein